MSPDVYQWALIPQGNLSMTSLGLPGLSGPVSEVLLPVQAGCFLSDQWIQRSEIDTANASLAAL
jgi:hypothetical protein